MLLLISGESGCVKKQQLEPTLQYDRRFVAAVSRVVLHITRFGFLLRLARPPSSRISGLVVCGLVLAWPIRSGLWKIIGLEHTSRIHRVATQLQQLINLLICSDQHILPPQGISGRGIF